MYSFFRLLSTFTSIKENLLVFFFCFFEYILVFIKDRQSIKAWCAAFSYRFDQIKTKK
ncbi:hypothetical protein CUZ95_0611 [Enterococcus lactis]|nr:hypothetical protein [Enterococcus lactis]